jgi:3-oxoacyl-[acyl-carrier protein] reductase
VNLGLTDRVVLITGASGGIGRALAEAFAAEGARLALVAFRNRPALEARLADGWPFAPASPAPDRALALQADVSDPAQIETAMRQAETRFGRIDHCIVNAGIWAPRAERLDAMTPERARATLEVNLFGALWTARAFLQSLGRTGPRGAGEGASLTFVGSTAGRFGERGNVDYATSKAGLYGMVRSLKNEIVTIDASARVNLIEPGWTVTEMTQATLAAPDAIPRIARTMPLRQLATGADIARAAAFLASPIAARHISGEIVTIAGGMEGRVLWEESEIDAASIRRRLGLEPTR